MDESVQVNAELETIFENGSKKSFLLSEPPAPRGNNHENPLFFDLLPQVSPNSISLFPSTHSPP